ncbi:cytochrome p450 [Aureococcus anophagefferens]|nr:cytochrome p450 [Aureococcus anophagefferens]
MDAFSTMQALMDAFSMHALAHTTAIAGICCAVVVLVVYRRADDGGIPWATGALPVLGHALAYQKGPADFVAAQCRAVGPVFRVNLAGKRMVVVGDSLDVVRQVTRAPERALSSKDAVAAVGFAETLGRRNVFEGTDFHKRTLKGAYGDGRLLAEEFPALHAALEAAFAVEAPGGAVADLFDVVRRCVLRATLDRFVGGGLVARGGPRLIDELMGFQDAVESATAAAAVLPRWLSLPAVLWPVARRRRALQRTLAASLAPALAAADGGPGSGRSRHGAVRRRGAAAGPRLAAHKNPAIGAAQASCSSRPRAATARARARAAAAPAARRVSSLATAALMRAYEALRCTAHTIGAVRVAKEPLVLAGTWPVRRGETIALSPRRVEPVPGGGVHKCPGEKVALVLVAATLAVLVRRGATPTAARPICFERATLAQRKGAVPAVFNDV